MTFKAFRLSDAGPNLMMQSLQGAFLSIQGRFFKRSGCTVRARFRKKLQTAFGLLDKPKQLLSGFTRCRTGCSTIRKRYRSGQALSYCRIRAPKILS